MLQFGTLVLVHLLFIVQMYKYFRFLTLIGTSLNTWLFILLREMTRNHQKGKTVLTEGGAVLVEVALKTFPVTSINITFTPPVSP